MTFCTEVSVRYVTAPTICLCLYSSVDGIEELTAWHLGGLLYDCLTEASSCQVADLQQSD